MNILVVSGFLGAGKTTFIKELVKNVERQVAVLENEYGEVDLDSDDIKKSTGDNVSDVLEFMEGCVCCTKKDVFTNSLIAISASLDPEFLVIEPTGVAKLGSLLENINKITWEKITLLKPVVVVAPRSYYSNISEYPEICDNQIRNAGIIVLSKIENEDNMLIQQVCEDIHRINPNVNILTKHYGNLDKNWWESLLKCEIKYKKCYKNDKDNASINDDKYEIDEYTIKDVSMKNVGELVSLLEDTIRGLEGNVIRAKGVLKVDGEWLRFDLADGLYSIVSYEAEESQSRCVFIGRDIKRDNIFSRFEHQLKVKMKLNKVKNLL